MLAPTARRCATMLIGVLVLASCAFEGVDRRDRRSWALKMEAGVKAFRTGDYRESLARFRVAAGMAEKFTDQDHRKGTSFHHFASVQETLGHFAEAEANFKRALAIYRTAGGSEHSNVAATLGSLGSLYTLLGRFGEAESLLQRALTLASKADGTDHPIVAAILNAIGQLYFEQGRYAGAGTFFERALSIRKAKFGNNDLRTI